MIAMMQSKLGMSVAELSTYAIVLFAVIAGVVVVARLFMEAATSPIVSTLGIKWLSERRRRQRQALFEAKILELTMGLANAMKSGMAFPQALEKVSAQLGGVMQEEIAVMLREYRLGMSVTDSLERLAAKMPGEDIRLLASAVRLTTQTGGSLVDVLAKLVDTIRNRTEFQEKLRTLTAQGRFEAIAMASAPIAAFCILYLCQPDLMRPLVTTLIGWAAIGVVLVLELVGFVVIKKIVTIEV